MKKALLVLAFIALLGSHRYVVAQAAGEGLSEAKKYYITSYYDVDVYRHYRKVATLKRGTRAQVLKTTGRWMLVRFWANGASVVGWIRR